jgi:hypothetical protein
LGVASVWMNMAFSVASVGHCGRAVTGLDIVTRGEF